MISDLTESVTHDILEPGVYTSNARASVREVTWRDLSGSVFETKCMMEASPRLSDVQFGAVGTRKLS